MSRLRKEGLSDFLAQRRLRKNELPAGGRRLIMYFACSECREDGNILLWRTQKVKKGKFYSSEISLWNSVVQFHKLRTGFSAKLKK